MLKIIQGIMVDIKRFFSGIFKKKDSPTEEQAKPPEQK